LDPERRIIWKALLRTSQLRRPPLREIRHAVAAALDREPLRVHFRWTGERWRALVEIIGVSGITPESVTQIHEALPEKIAKEVEMLVWRRSDFFVTESGFTDYDTLVEPYMSRQTEQLRGLFRTDVVPKHLSPSANATESLDGRK
jgi:hypothetical protein